MRRTPGHLENFNLMRLDSDIDPARRMGSDEKRIASGFRKFRENETLTHHMSAPLRALEPLSAALSSPPADTGPSATLCESEIDIM